MLVMWMMVGGGRGSARVQGGGGVSAAVGGCGGGARPRPGAAAPHGALHVNPLVFGGDSHAPLRLGGTGGD